MGIVYGAIIIKGLTKIFGKDPEVEFDKEVERIKKEIASIQVVDEKLSDDGTVNGLPLPARMLENDCMDIDIPVTNKQQDLW